VLLFFMLDLFWQHSHLNTHPSSSTPAKYQRLVLYSLPFPPFLSLSQLQNLSMSPSEYLFQLPLRPLMRISRMQSPLLQHLKNQILGSHSNAKPPFAPIPSSISKQPLKQQSPFKYKTYSVHHRQAPTRGIID